MGLVVAVQVVGSATAEAGLQSAVAASGRAGLVEVSANRIQDQGSYESFESGLDVSVRARSEGALEFAGQHAEVLGYVPVSHNGRVANLGPASTVALMSYPGLERHVTVVAQDAGALSVSETAAQELKVSAGDQLCFSLLVEHSEWCGKVGLVWRPRDGRELYWGSNGPPREAIVLSEDDLFRVAGSTGQANTAAYRGYAPVPARIHAAGGRALVFSLKHLAATLAPPNSDVHVDAGLASVLSDALDRADVGTFTIELVTAQVLLVTAGYVALLGSRRLGLDRQQVSVWRSRGWSWRGIWLLLAMEVLGAELAAVPAGVAGGWAAGLAAARAAYPALPESAAAFDPRALALPLGAALAILTGVLVGEAAAASRRSVLGARRESSRPPLAPWWRRRYLDLGLALLAIPLLAQSQLLGSGRLRSHGDLGSDPVSLLLPGLAALLLALAALRGLPVIAHLAGRPKRSAGARLAAIQLGRNPAQHTVLALLLVATVALGVFSAAFAATANRNALDRASYQAGAGLRAELVSQAPPDAAALAALPGAGSVSLVQREEGNQAQSRTPVELLGVDPTTVGAVAWSRPGLTGDPLPDLLGHLARADKLGLALPDATGLSVWVEGAGPGATASLAARLVDAGGRAGTAPFGSLAYSGWRQLTASFDFPIPPLQPVRLQYLSFAGAGDRDARVALGALAAIQAGGRTLVLERFSDDLAKGPRGSRFGTASDWWQTDAASGTGAGSLLPDQAVRQPDGSLGVPLLLPAGGLQVQVHTPLAGQAVPGIAIGGSLADLGVRLGETVEVRIANYVVPITLIGTAPHFPTLYPERTDAVVVPEDGLSAWLAQPGHARPWPNEAWFSTTPAQSAQLAAALSDRPETAALIPAASARSAAIADPGLVRLQSNLVIGFVATLVLALLGFGLHFLIVARLRQSEFAILMANGLPAALLPRSLLVEQALLAVYCALAGTVLGGVLAAALLPALQIGASVEDVVPETVVALDPVRLAAVIGTCSAGALLAGRLVVAAAGRPRLLDELRRLG